MDRLYLLNDIDCQFEIRKRISDNTVQNISGSIKMLLAINKKYGALAELAKSDISALMCDMGVSHHSVRMNILHALCCCKDTSVNKEILMRKIIKLHPGLLYDAIIENGITQEYKTPDIIAFHRKDLIAATLFACAKGNYKCLIVRDNTKSDIANDQSLNCPIRAIACATVGDIFLIFIRSNLTVIPDHILVSLTSEYNIGPSNVEKNERPEELDKYMYGRVNKIMSELQHKKWLASSCDDERVKIAESLNPATLALMVEFACAAEFPPNGLNFLCPDLVLEIVGWLI